MRLEQHYRDHFFEEILGAFPTIAQKFKCCTSELTRALLARTFWYFKTFLRCGQLLKLFSSESCYDSVETLVLFFPSHF